MASHPNYVKKQIAIDNVSWTAVVAPIDCQGVGIKNSVAVDLKVRTDSADPATQDTISAGSQEGVMMARTLGNVQFDLASQRFRAGETVCFLQATSGTGPALATFVR
jgi:hypothetical protein